MGFFIKNISMRGDKLLREQKLNRIYEKSGIGMVNNTNLIIVDIQPEYENAFGFNLYQFTEFLNENFESLNSLTFLYNGADTLGMVSEGDFKYWLLDNGVGEEVLDQSDFYDKGYAFFRYCMDEGIEDDDTVALVRFMIKHNIHDSRNFNDKLWNLFLQENNIDQSNVKDLLEFADDAIHIPDLIDYLKKFNGNIVLCGGGINECLKEVEIALMAMNKQYRVLTKYTY